LYRERARYNARYNADPTGIHTARTLPGETITQSQRAVLGGEGFQGWLHGGKEEAEINRLS